MTSGVGVFYLYVNGKPMDEEVLKPGFTHYAKTIAGPVRHAAIFDGEEFDAREAEGFMSAPALGKAETNSEFAGGIFPSEGAEIYRREDLALSPVNAYTWQGVTDATDDAFGKIIVSRQFRKGGMIMRYTFGKDKGFVRYSPRCTFYGFRFISVTADREVRIRSVKSVPVTSIASRLETGRITTGNELVNKLISNTMWGLRSNYLSVPTDCPQRNERLGWTADTQVFAETGTYFANTRDFFHKWMRDMRDTQKESGGYPGVAPVAQYGAAPTDMTRLGWADAGIIVP